MSWSSNITVPSTRASGMVSCMRLRQRSRVDLPQPDGPMIAVTSFAGKSRFTSRTACVDPNHALSEMACIASCRSGGSATAPPPLVPSTSIMAAAVTGSRDEPRGEADDENEADEDDGARPGLPVPVVVRADGIGEDLQWKSGDGLPQVGGPELIAECGEEQRCGFAGHACDSH